MDIGGEMLADDGFCVYVASIIAWNDSNGELIDDSEKNRIAQNIKLFLESQGMHLVLTPPVRSVSGRVRNSKKG